jgi:flagellar basal-body rod protein FlgB
MVAAIEGNTKVLIGMALDATSMRQQAIAQNIANVNTPGYQALDVSFEDQLSDVREMLEQGHGVTSSALAGHRPSMVLADPTGANGSGVSLEMELAKLSENTLHQQVLLKMLNTHYAVMNSAMK